MSTLDRKQSQQAEAGQAIHATCIVIGTKAILLRGPSGVGKTSLAIELVQRAQHLGIFAAFISDDRVFLSEANGSLIAAAPTTIQGLAELRGYGIITVPKLKKAPVALLLDFEPRADIERMPDSNELICEICSVKIKRQPLPQEDSSAALRLSDFHIFTNLVHN